MAFKDLVSLYFERSNAMQTFWGFYITIVLGLLAFFGTAKPSPKKILLAGILSLGFIGFAVVNQDALHDVTHARVVTQRLIAEYQDTDPVKQAAIDQIKTTITPPTESGVRVFHICADIGVLIAIWSLTLYREPGR
jgi:H+/gluconate symporter-like permease